MATTADKLEEKRKGYSAEGQWHRLLLDSYGGTGGYQGRLKHTSSGFWGAAAAAYSPFSGTRDSTTVVDETQTYLDRYPREPEDKFARRVAVAHYPNYVKPVTNLKISYIVRKPHQRNNVPDSLTAWIERTGYDRELRRRALVTAVFGWFPLVVSKPQPAEGATSEANAGNMDPFVRIAFPCNLYDYGERDGVCTWAKIGDRYCDKASWDAEPDEFVRYQVLTPKGFETWEKRATQPQATKVAEGTHAFLQVPIVTWRTDASVEDAFKSDSLNAEIVSEVRRLFNLISELDETMRSNVFPLLIVPSSGTSDEGTGGGTEKQLGNNNGITVSPDQKNLPQFIAPPASVTESYEKRIEKTIIEIYRMARVEYDKASGIASSAQSQEQNFQQTNLSIVDFAKSLANADRETLILVGRGLGIPEPKLQAIECVAHDSYAEGDLNEEISQVISMATDLAVGDTATAELTKRLLWRVLNGIGAKTRAIIEGEVDAEVAKKRQERELSAANADSAAAADTNKPDDTPNVPPPSAANPGAKEAA